MRAKISAFFAFFASPFTGFTANWPTAGIDFKNGDSFNDLTGLAK